MTLPPSTSPGETLIDVLRVGAHGRMDKVAISSLDRTMTYWDLIRESADLALALRDLGSSRGTRIAYLGRDSTHFVSTLFAAAINASVLIPVNWRFSRAEVHHLVADARADFLLVDDELADLVEGIEGTSIISMERVKEAVRTGAEPARFSTSAEPEDPAWLIYTSGTTGRPKGVVLTHANSMVTIDGVAAAWEISDSSVVYVPYPTFHLTGIGWVLKTLRAGGTVVQRSRFDLDDLLDSLENHGVTNTLLIPTVLGTLIYSPRATPERLASLRSVVYGVEPMTDALLERARELMPECRFIHVYGMTESCGQATFMSWEERLASPERFRSCGRAYPWVEMKIVDPDSLADLPAGATGEVWLRGPNVMPGYFDNDEATASAITPDGWLRTGDGGHVDDEGYLVLTARLNDMIISGGENIYPAEVENVLVRHAAVREVGVVGAADPTWGERVCAFVVRRDAVEVTEAELISYAREHLAHYKCPSSVYFLGELPKTPSGKLQRSRLRADASAQQGSLSPSGVR
ncbi:AMP-binding protein [Nocardioides sp. zg-ZUI104]|uniref:class I adenylate-forming enzyme family protein n=1 Tax=Nocardioides faecalis TaxID=2803858 RepID=UPI001BCD78C2|nr:AMP-binding protein [Nocardioides faecalis]MBS4754552.1 AMP-binding protein [Nocardioides faecalis]